MNPIAIYVHVPFCARHCAYCDFNTYVEERQSRVVQATVDAICRDMARTARENPETAARPVASVFFGGGTPTFLTGAQLTSILNAIRDAFTLLPDAEISSEANPTSSDAEKFAAMRAAGFNRLSIGVQAFDNALLTALDRFHTAGEAERAFQSAREAGFDNINLDLMFRLPKQTPALWEASVGRALELGPEHLSLYALTLEPGTRFERLHAGGKLPLPDEDAELSMYERCIVRLTAAGYEHYEVSNFALPGFRCRHNLTYWHNEEYLGFGPGAVSYLSGRRWKRERLPVRYVQKMEAGTDLSVETETLDANASLGETMMLGLRLREGVDGARIRSRYGADLYERFAPQITRLLRDGYLERSGDCLRLTPSGLLIADTVAAEFLS